MVDLSPNQFLGGPPQLGEILVCQGLIQQEQLLKALSYKQEHDLFLGQALVALRYVTEEDLVRALRSQQLVEAIHLTPDIVDQEVAEELGYEKCTEFRCIPVNRIADHVTLAMENPADLLGIQEITGRMKSRIMPVFAEPRRIQEAMRVHFGKTASKMSAVELARRVDQLARELTIASGVRAAVSENQSDDPLVIEFMEVLLEEAFGQSASSVHFESRGKKVHIRYRLGDVLDERCTLPAARASDLIARLQSLSDLSGDSADGPRYGRGRRILGGREVELCVTAAPGAHGQCAVIAFVDNPPGEHDLGATGLTAEQQDQLLRICRTGQGLVVAAGPMGAGKTSFMRALLANLRHPERKFISLDEPLGQALEGVMHLNKFTGDSDSPRGLRTALHMEADVIVTGELPGPRITALAAQAASDQRLVLSSVCATGALDAIAQLQRLGLGQLDLSNSLSVIVGQRVVRRLCPDCRSRIAPEDRVQDEVSVDESESDASESDAQLQNEPQPKAMEHGDEADTDEFFHAGEGCDLCRGSGYFGRVGLFEILEINDELRDLIASSATPEEIARHAYWADFTDLRSQGLQLAREGVTSLAEVLAATVEGNQQ